MNKWQNGGPFVCNSPVDHLKTDEGKASGPPALPSGSPALPQWAESGAASGPRVEPPVGREWASGLLLSGML